jgi:maleate cis-trans isomerase
MRAGGYDLDQVPDSDQMRRFADASLGPVLEALCAARPHGVIYGCTSATLSHGIDYDNRFVERMQGLSGVPCVTAAGSLVTALGALGARRIAFGSPYTRQLNEEGAEFLRGAGFDVIKTGYIGSDLGNYGQSELEPDEVFRLGLDADHPDADTLVLSCTDMRAVEVIDALEARLGKPVVSSNQASMFTICEKLGCGANLPGRLRLAG